MEAAAAHVQHFLPDFSPQDLSTVLLALTRAGCRDEALLALAADEVRRQITGFSATDTLRTLTALAAAGYRGQRCVRALAQSVRKNIDTFFPVDLAEVPSLLYRLECDVPGVDGQYRPTRHCCFMSRGLAFQRCAS